MHLAVEETKCKMFYGECIIYWFPLPWRMLSFLVTTIYSRILQRLLLIALLRFDIALKKNTITLIFSFAGTPSWWMFNIPINPVYIIETNKILKVKCLLNKFFFIDQDTYWTHPNGCLNSDMFYLDKLHLVEKENLVLAKTIYRLIEYSHRIITRNEFKTSYN